MAFGVGMKLTQPQAQAAAAAPKIDLNPLAQRIREMEQRIDALQEAPRTVAVTGAAGSFDQKVLEAVVNALDARLHEHAGQVERRLTELEAKITIELKDLDHQDQALARGTQARLDEVRAAVREEVSGLHGQVGSMQHELVAALARMVQEQVEKHVAAQVLAQMQARIPSLEQSIQQQVSAALAAQVRPFEQQWREEARQAAGRAITLAASAADATVEEKLGPVRAELSVLRANMERAAARLEMAAEERLRPLRSELAAAQEAARQAGQAVDQKLVPLRAEMAALRADVERAAARLESAAEEQLRPLRSDVAAAQESARQAGVGVDEKLVPLRAEVAVLRTDLERAAARLESAAEEQLGRLRSDVAAAHEAARQAGLAVDEKIVPLRVDLQQKSREIAELRERVGETDRSVLDMILSIGVMCRQTAERIGTQPPATMSTPPPAQSAAEPGASQEAAPPRVLHAGASSAPPDVEPAGASGGSGGPGATGAPCDATPSPKFAQSENPIWKIPLVSSFLVATGGLLLLHYL